MGKYAPNIDLRLGPRIEDRGTSVTSPSAQGIFAQASGLMTCCLFSEVPRQAASGTITYSAGQARPRGTQRDRGLG